MEIRKPSDAELAALLAEHAGRFPDKASLTVADGGKSLRLPLLLGNPAEDSAAWRRVVAVTFRYQSDEGGLNAELADECVLYPPKATWAEWVGRWPALPSALLVPLRRKMGASLDMIEEPAFDEPAPAEIADALAKHEGAVWRRLTPPGASIDVVIRPPSLGLWRMFQQAAKKPRADVAAKVAELAAASVVAASQSFSDAVKRWPGLSVLVVAAVGELAGVSAEAELGEW